jgi:hypothetical protein
MKEVLAGLFGIALAMVVFMVTAYFVGMAAWLTVEAFQAGWEALPNVFG